MGRHIIVLSAVSVILSGLLSLGVGIKKWRYSPPALKILTGLLIFQTVANSMELVLALSGTSNMVLFRIYLPITYALLAWIYSYFFSGLWVSITRYSIPAYTAILLLLMFYDIEPIEGPNIKYSLSLLSLLVVVLSLYTFYLLDRSKTVALHHDYRFWLVIGSLVFFGSNIVIFSTMSNELILAIWPVSNLSLILSYLLYLKGYLCLR